MNRPVQPVADTQPRAWVSAEQFAHLNGFIDAMDARMEYLLQLDQDIRRARFEQTRFISTFSHHPSIRRLLDHYYAALAVMRLLEASEDNTVFLSSADLYLLRTPPDIDSAVQRAEASLADLLREGAAQNDFRDRYAEPSPQQRVRRVGYAAAFACAGSLLFILALTFSR